MNPARREPLGKTELQVTQLGIGTVPIGGLYQAVSDEAAQATLQAAWDAGIRFYDTAPLYGFGLAERRLGAFLATKPRDEYVLATKVGRLLRADALMDPDLVRDGEVLFRSGLPLQPVFDFSYDGVMRSFAESLARLGLDRVDILHIHDPDDYYDQALAGAFKALDKLRGEGVIKAVGAGMNQAEMLTRFAREAAFDCFLLAGRYTLLDQSALAELLPTCARLGIKIIIGGVYNSGILTDPRPGAKFNYREADYEWLEKAQRIQAVCDRYDVPLPAAAIQFPLAHPAVATILTGVRSPDELRQNVAYCQLPIPPGLWDELRVMELIPAYAPAPGEVMA
jgi:D-threo-aldose 1-dehydrogenase